MRQQHLDQEAKKAIGASIRDHISRSGMSRENYCLHYGMKLSTLNKLATGVFTESGLAKLERNVGRSFRHGTGPLERAADDLGAYLHSEYRYFEGDYTLVRHAFERPERICLFPIRIDWDDAKPGLRISNRASGEHQKFAYMALPKGAPYLFVDANESGWRSLMIFSIMDVVDEMCGVMLTTGSLSAGTYVPFFMPVLLRKEKGAVKKFREIDEADVSFTALRKRLADVMFKKFARLP